ncbi:Phage portal protein [compost metagenome]
MHMRHARHPAKEADLDLVAGRLRLQVFCGANLGEHGRFLPLDAPVLSLEFLAPLARRIGHAIQILPVSDVAAKDEFFNIKSVTRDDQLAAHRVPPQLMGILPNNAGGFGAVEPAARVFARNELVPLQAQFMAINEWAGVEVVRFAPYDLATGGEGAQ